MGLLDFTANVLTKYKADVQQHVKELQKLKGEEAKRAEEAIAKQKALNASLETQIAAINLVKSAADLAGSAFAKWNAAIKDYAEVERVAAGSSRANIERLKTASGGLRAELDLQRTAAKLWGGEFKTGQTQLEEVERAMASFVLRGKEQSKVTEAVTGAVTKLSTDGLQELGIHINKTGLSMDDAKDRTELYRRIMAELRKEAEKTGEAEETKGVKAVKASVSLEEATDKLKRGFGELATALAPFVAKVAEFVALLPKLPKTIGRPTVNFAVGTVGKWALNNILPGGNPLPDYSAVLDEENGYGSMSDIIAQQVGRVRRARNALIEKDFGRVARIIMNVANEDDKKDASAVLPIFKALGDLLGPETTKKPVGDKYIGKAKRDELAAKWKEHLSWLWGQTKEATDAVLETIQADIEKMNKDAIGDWNSQSRIADPTIGGTRMFGAIPGDKNGRVSGPYAAYLRRMAGTNDATAVARLLRGLTAGGVDLPTDSVLGGDPFAIPSPNKQFDADVGKALDKFYGRGGEFQRRKTGGILERMFGPIEEFDAYKRGLEALGGAITTFANAAGAGFSAWIDGSMSAGDAFRKFMADAMKATAAQLLVESIKEGVMALVSLARHDPLGAAMHGKAAAAAAAGAIAIGGIAKATHSAGWAGAGSSRAPSTGREGTGGGRGGNTYVVVYGDPAASHMEQRNARKLIKKVMGGEGVKSN